SPRIDIEPLYTALKGHVGERWTEYKDAVKEFILGRLDQRELSRLIDWFICVDPVREHLHNQLICAIYANCFREPPEPGVASWVSANDKPSAAAKPDSGDAAALRLKTEVKELQGRERKRLKAIPEVSDHMGGPDPNDHVVHELVEYHNAKQIHPPDTGSVSAGGFNKTNWDLEIRKRYAQPLSTETFEFPDQSAIEARMTPICYEEGIASGASTDCASFMNIATETFIKEMLSNIMGRVKSNGEDYIKTAAYKRQLEKEEQAFLNGELQKTPSGLLPVEAAEIRARQAVDMADLRIALELGDSYLGQTPLLAATILNGRPTEEDIYEADAEFTVQRRRKRRIGRNRPKVGAGDTNGTSNGTNGVHDDPMMLDENDWGWQGGLHGDRDAVNDVLDDIL
ncbi:hypothetical protein K490DRAFT_19029, partial [Saccharata proteae CBS 121410]